MLFPEEIETELDVRKLNIKVSQPSISGETVYAPVAKLYKTIPMKVCEMKLANKYRLKCSVKHKVLVDGLGWYEVGRIQPGMYVLTETGAKEVRSVKHSPIKENLYEMSIEKGHPPIYFSNGILSHNSTTFCARQMSYAHIIPGYKSLYVVPHFDHLKTYAARFQDMESLWRVHLGAQRVYKKQYGLSSIEMLHCGESAKAVRGKTVDEVLIDEAQNMDPDIIGEILFTQTTSKMPSTIFAGTALSVDTLLESKWQDSSFGVWHVRAGDGKTWLNMYDSDTLFKVCSNPQGPTCPITGKLLDMTDGCFVHGDRLALAQGRVGLHVPQCIIPDMYKDPVQWMKIYNHVMRDDPKKTMQECFGIAVAAGTREITERDLMRLCDLKESEEELVERCAKGYYRLIVSGCDWGGSDYNPIAKTKTSYTVHCIIGVRPDDAVDILHYKRYAGMDYENIAGSILHDHKKFHAHLMASDFGVGMAYNMLMRKAIPYDKHFIMTYVGPQAAPLSEPKNSHLPNQLSLNKTEAVTAVFSAVKTLTPQRIHARSWEYTKDYLSDWLNMYRAPSDTDTGTKFRYIRVSNKADDALHAFAFAYVLLRFFIGDPIVKDPTLEKRLRDIMQSPNTVIRPRPMDARDFMIYG